MNPSPGARRVLLGISLTIFLYVCWNGLSVGLRQIPESHSPGQLVQTACQIAYGSLALLSAVTTFWARRWGPWVRGCWVISVTLAAGIAPVVWGGAKVATGLLAGAGIMLVALAVVWLLRTGARSLTGT